MKPTLSGRFFMRPWEIYTSHSFRVLNLNERRCLDLFELELLKHAGKDNGKLIVTYADMRRWGIAPQYATASVRVLKALGLIELMQQGRACNGEFRTPNLWRITYMPTAPNKKDQTHDWMNIKSLDQAKAIADANRFHDRRERPLPSARRKPGRA